MKLLWHSNGIHKVEKDKVSKRKIFKKIIIFFVGLLVVGFVIQNISNLIDNTRLKQKSKFARIDGKKMEYKVKTSGDYTVVFDGAIGNNMYEWDEVCKSLESKKISTFIYNRRGYGFSEGGGNRLPEDQAKDLKLLLRKAGAPEPYILVGEEYGSLVVTNFVNLYSDSVAGVVLANPVSEDEMKTKQFNQAIKSKYYRSSFEEIGTNFGLTSLLSKMGLTMRNSTFEEHLTENELDEFNSFKNRTDYKQAVTNEIGNLYRGTSSSQINGLLGSKPLYLITNKDEEPLTTIGDANSTTVYKEEIDGSPISVLDSDTIVNGIDSVIKDAKKLAKKS